MFVAQAMPVADGDIINLSEGYSISQTSDSVPVLPEARRVRVLFEYMPEDERMLPIAPGDILEIVGEEEGWLIGCNVETGAEGFVPPDYIEDILSD